MEVGGKGNEDTWVDWCYECDMCVEGDTHSEEQTCDKCAGMAVGDEGLSCESCNGKGWIKDEVKVHYTIGRGRTGYPE